MSSQNINKDTQQNRLRVIRDNIVRIEVDTNKMEVRAGDYICDTYKKHKWWHLAAFVGGAPFRCSTKDKAKYYNDRLGMPPALYCKLFNNKMYDLWVKPYQSFVSKFCMDSRGPIPCKLKEFHTNKEKYLQMVEDNQENLIPIMLEAKSFLRDTPNPSVQDLKKAIGKGQWKSLCSNTVSRNKLIAKHLGKPVSGHVEVIKLCRDLPSSFIKYGEVDNTSDFVVRHMKGRLSKPSAYDRPTLEDTEISYGYLRHLSTDTRQMSQQLGEKYSNNWSLSRMQQQHDKYTNLINERKYSKDKIPWLEKLPQTITSDEGSYTATLLTSAYEVHQEGTQMNHCVGSYTGMVVDGNYLVYSIKDKDGKGSSTLGIRYAKSADERSGTATFNQHYKSHNRCVEDKEEILLAEKTLNEINKRS